MEIPTKEQVQAIKDIPALQRLQDDIERSIAKIEVDLDFKEGDDEWHARARGALAVHQVGLNRIKQRIRQLTKKPDDKFDQFVEMKTAKTERIAASAERTKAFAARVAAEDERKRIKLEERKVRAQENMYNLLKRTSFLSRFYISAAKILPANLLEMVVKEATDTVLYAMEDEVQKAQLVAVVQ